MEAVRYFLQPLGRSGYCALANSYLFGELATLQHVFFDCLCEICRFFQRVVVSAKREENTDFFVRTVPVNGLYDWDKVRITGNNHSAIEQIVPRIGQQV